MAYICRKGILCPGQVDDCRNIYKWVVSGVGSVQKRGVPVRKGIFTTQESKKGSLNLSINAIVIVVLAFVMLGLGLTLTRTVFSNITEQAVQINEQVRQQILDDLRTGNKPLSFPQNNVNVRYGEDKTIAFGIKNTGSGTRQYCAVLYDFHKDATNETNIEFFYEFAPQELSPQQTQVIPVSVATSGEEQGLYRGKINVYEYNSEDDTNSDMGVDDCQIAFTTDGSGTNTEAGQPVSQDKFPDHAAGDTGWRVYAQKSFFIRIQ